MRSPHVLVMAKAPVPGRVKTRLCPPCSPAQAATIAEAALADTLEAVAACGAARKAVALDGDPGPWMPAGFEVLHQRGDTLSERLAHAWADVGGPGIQIGMDTPQVAGSDLDQLLAMLQAASPGRHRRAVLGPAVDGGWWVIGLPVCDPVAVFAGVPTSSPQTGVQQHRRLLELGFDVAVAARRRDVDTIEDLLAVAASSPCTRTAAAARRLGLAGGAA